MSILFLIASLVIIIDRLTKYLALDNLLQDRSIDVIPNIFHLTLVLNTGAAFGLFKHFTFFFIAMSLFVIALICFYAFRFRQKDMIVSGALGLILGGAAGNLIDRLLFGYVIDFLDFRIWPVFNIADSCITIGAILLTSKFILDKKCFTQ